MAFYIVAIFIASFDQLLKYFVSKYMYLGQSIPLIPDILYLTYVRNTGAAFSLFVGFSSYLTIVGVIVTLVVIYFHIMLPKHEHYVQSALACVLAGSLGNLFDRVSRGYVVDFIDFRVWPVFNLADIMINIGVVLLAIYILKKK